MRALRASGAPPGRPGVKMHQGPGARATASGRSMPHLPLAHWKLARKARPKLAARGPAGARGPGPGPEPYRQRLEVTAERTQAETTLAGRLAIAA